MTDARDTLRAWLEEALELRGSLGLAPYDDLVAPFQITEQLTNVRARLDRVEELRIKAVRAKASVKKAHQKVKDELQDAWDSHVTNTSAVRRPVLTQEYVTGKEKFAEANLATFEQRKAERKSGELLSFAEETLEVIHIIHRGLNDIRQDLLSQVRSIQIESQLER